jgi:hypothetical protein
MVRASTLGAFVLAAAIGGPATAAEDPAAVARARSLGAFVAETPWCGKMGFKLVADPAPYGQATIAEGVRGGLQASQAKAYLLDGIKSQNVRVAAENKALADAPNADDDAALLKLVTGTTQAKAALCHAMADDPVGRLLVTAPIGQTPAASARLVADGFLEAAGLASWQTPYIKAGGELSYAVGVCEAHLTQPQAETYLGDLYTANRFTIGVERKAKTWFAWMRQNGSDQAADINFSPAQCQKVLSGRAATLKAAQPK